ncbi:LysR substrate-binding domain-containing protein [Thalassotalea ponticola]|uniref:hydrogen peroxide-inducible genes activator n=1 Tax=Thalassotalea ponticola TaxID=1523392 RepID=UPI0025B32F34|nr:hydrogen peroxide-inducible genes activator [Thalassotalea ponticola]MDN3652946.1 LysR substrate-binding domain-containing protein [Thalassotalea ponticola]
MVTLKQIQYALAVDKTRHFKNAALACHVSQSALSTAISELEKHLGVQLFERNNKQVLVTAFGREFLTKARQIQVQIDELEQLTAVNKSPLSAPMAIGVIPTIGPYLLPKVLPALREQYPEFKLKIVEEQSHVLVDMVRNGELDSAILALPYETSGLLTFQFWQEDFYWITHCDNVSTAKQHISSAELKFEKLMLLKDGHCLKDHALAACHLQGYHSDDEFDSASLYTLIQMVAGKLGTTLVPEMALSQLIYPQSELAALHLSEPGPHRSIAFITRANYVRVNDITLLQQLFKNELNSHAKSTQL